MLRGYSNENRFTGAVVGQHTHTQEQSSNPKLTTCVILRQLQPIEMRKTKTILLLGDVHHFAHNVSTCHYVQFDFNPLEHDRACEDIQLKTSCQMRAGLDILCCARHLSGLLWSGHEYRTY